METVVPFPCDNDRVHHSLIWSGGRAAGYQCRQSEKEAIVTGTGTDLCWAGDCEQRDPHQPRTSPNVTAGNSVEVTKNGLD